MTNLYMGTPSKEHTIFLRNINKSLSYWLTWLEMLRQKNYQKDQSSIVLCLDQARTTIVKTITIAVDFKEVPLKSIIRLVEAFSSYMEMRGHWQTWSQVLEKVLERARSDQDIKNHVFLTVLHARLLFRQSKLQESVRSYKKALLHARKINDIKIVAQVCSNLGFYYIGRGFLIRAEFLCCHAYKIFEELQDAHGLAHTANHLGLLHMKRGMWPLAQVSLEQACKIWSVTGDKYGLINGHLNLGLLYCEMKSFTKAKMSLNEALECAELLGAEATTGIIYLNLGNVFRYEGDLTMAEIHYHRAGRIFEKHSMISNTAIIQGNMGLIYSERKQWAEAEICLRHAMQLWQKTNNRYEEIKTMGNFSYYEITKGNSLEAKGWLEKMRVAIKLMDPNGILYELKEYFDACQRDYQALTSSVP